MNAFKVECQGLEGHHYRGGRVATEGATVEPSTACGSGDVFAQVGHELEHAPADGLEHRETGHAD
jgi:hypothetical protein